MRIDRFSGPYRFLSNFYPARVWLDGVPYRTVEHAYQAAKTVIPYERAIIRLVETPGRAKFLGTRLLTLRPDWEGIKRDVMLYLVRQKFADPDLALKLLATGTAELVEGNTWGDRYWGVCDGVGENHLGLILMRVRSEIADVLTPRQAARQDGAPSA